MSLDLVQAYIEVKRRECDLVERTPHPSSSSSTSALAPGARALQFSPKRDDLWCIRHPQTRTT